MVVAGTYDDENGGSCIKRLLAAGADSNVKDELGQTALDWAVMVNIQMPNIIQLLRDDAYVEPEQRSACLLYKAWHLRQYLSVWEDLSVVPVAVHRRQLARLSLSDTSPIWQMPDHPVWEKPLTQTKT